MSYRIAVDTGGTFTDVVLADSGGRLTFNKALTTPKRMFEGGREALRVIGDGLGMTLEQLLAEADLFVYATTRATNAIIEGTTARTAFFTTEGFPDVLTLREGGKMELRRGAPSGSDARGGSKSPSWGASGSGCTCVDERS